MIYYISDLHIGHENVIRYDGRPFRDSEEMTGVIVSRWNSRVRPQDDVYILGDYAWKNRYGLALLHELSGIKHLIRGNHDSLSQEMRSLFAEVRDYAEITDGGVRVVLFHYPIAHWNDQYRGAVHLYGHIHNTQDAAAFAKYAAVCKEAGIPFAAYNVGCMMPYMDYTPRTLREITEACGTLS